METNSITEILKKDETVLWMGRPNIEKFKKQEVISYSTFIGTCAAILVVMYFITRLVFCLVIALVALMGLCIIIESIRKNNLGWNSAHSAVTDRRVIQAVSAEGQIQHFIIEYSRLRDVRLHEEPDATGTIVCYCIPPRPLGGINIHLRGMDNARDLYNLILAAKARYEEGTQSKKHE